MVFIAVASIFLITLVVWLTNRILPFKVCSICVAVAGTWMWMLGAYLLGFPVDLFVPAILMGGSVVGIAYQVGKHLPQRRSHLLWESLFTPVGFFAVWSLLSFWWLGFWGAIALSLLIVVAFLSPPKRLSLKENEKVKELKEKMKECC